MTAPTFRYVSDTAVDTVNNIKYGAPDLAYVLHVLDGSHSTDRIQVQKVESVIQPFDVMVYQSGGNTIAKLANGDLLLSRVSNDFRDDLVLQAAMNQALVSGTPTNPLTVIIKPGIYKLGKPSGQAASFFVYSNTTVIGYHAFFTSTVYGARLLRVPPGNSKVSFIGLTFDFNNLGDQVQVQAQNGTGGVSNITFRDCIFKNPKIPTAGNEGDPFGGNVAGHSSRFLTVGWETVPITDVPNTPLYESENYKIINCDFDYTLPVGVTEVGDTVAIINFANVTGGLVQGCRFINLPWKKNCCIFVYHGNKDVKIIGNEFINTDPRCYADIRVAHSTNTIIAGNICSNRIRVVDSANTLVVNNNCKQLLIWDSDDVDHDGAVPVYRGCRHVLVANNTIENTSPGPLQSVAASGTSLESDPTTIRFRLNNNDANPVKYVSFIGNQLYPSKHAMLVEGVVNAIPTPHEGIVFLKNHIVNRDDITTTTNAGHIRIVGNTSATTAGGNGFKNIFIQGNYFGLAGGSTIHNDIDLTTTGLGGIVIRGNFLNNAGIQNIGSYVAGISGNFGTVSAVQINSNSGTATVGASSTSQTVTHGLAYTPTLDNIMVRPTGSLGTATEYWISTPTSTTFTINVDATPGGSGVPFAWVASRNE